MSTVWAGTTYIAGSGFLNKGAAGGEISCATKTGTNPPEIYFRSDNGANTWAAEPVLVGTITSGGKFCQCWYDGVYVHVYNGSTMRWRSKEYGRDGSWETY